MLHPNRTLEWHSGSTLPSLSEKEGKEGIKKVKERKEGRKKRKKVFEATHDGHAL